jgi:hypothetical protein
VVDIYNHGLFFYIVRMMEQPNNALLTSAQCQVFDISLRLPSRNRLPKYNDQLVPCGGLVTSNILLAYLSLTHMIHKPCTNG